MPQADAPDFHATDESVKRVHDELVHVLHILESFQKLPVWARSIRDTVQLISVLERIDGLFSEYYDTSEGTKCLYEMHRH